MFSVWSHEHAHAPCRITYKAGVSKLLPWRSGSKYLGFRATPSLLQLLSSAPAGREQPQTMCKWIWLCVKNALFMDTAMWIPYHCNVIKYSSWFFSQPCTRVKTILGSWIVQKQATEQNWPRVIVCPAWELHFWNSIWHDTVHQEAFKKLDAAVGLKISGTNIFLN